MRRYDFNMEDFDDASDLAFKIYEEMFSDNEDAEYIAVIVDDVIAGRIQKRTINVYKSYIDASRIISEQEQNVYTHTLVLAFNRTKFVNIKMSCWGTMGWTSSLWFTAYDYVVNNYRGDGPKGLTAYVHEMFSTDTTIVMYF